MMRRLTLFLWCLLILAPALPALAQDADDSRIRPPVVILQGDSVWQFDGQMSRNLVNGDTLQVQSIALSPDGRWLAYRYLAPVFYDAVARTGGFSGPGVQNVRLQEIASGTERLIADQPDPAVLLVDGQENNVFARSAPKWAPDGSAVAWTDYAWDGSGLTLSVHDLGESFTRSYPLDIPPLLTLPIEWIDSGILMDTFDYGTDERTLHLYSPTGVLLNRLVVTPPVPNAMPYGPELIVRHAGRDHLAQYLTESGTWRLTDLLSGAVYSTTVFPEFVSRVNPDGGIRATLSAADPDSESPFAAEVLAADGSVLIPTYPVDALHTDSTLDLYFDGEAQVVGHLTDRADLTFYGETTAFGFADAQLLIQDVAWGHGVWRLPAGAEIALIEEAPAFECPDALPPRLTIGQDARVRPGDPNRLRSAPNTDAPIVGQLPGGTAFSVTGGPVCDSGIVWWQVSANANALSGWTAEGVDEYFVEPLTP